MSYEGNGVGIQTLFDEGIICDSDIEATLAEGLVAGVVDAESIANAQKIGVIAIEAAIVEADGKVVNRAHPRSTVTGIVEESRQAKLLTA